MNDFNRTTGYAWITGGGTGLGRSLALLMADEGWQVCISGRRREPLEETRDQAAGSPGVIKPVVCDVTNPQAVKEAVNTVEAAGALDLCVLNAGTYAPFKVKNFSIEPFRNTMEINYMGTIHCLDAILPPLRERGRGHIVITGSVAGYRGLPLAAPYGATKAALINLAESLKFDLNGMGINVSVVNPGFVKTPLTARNRFSMPFLMEVDDAARLMWYGIKAKRFEIAFPWQLVWSLKLLRALPYPLYFPLARKGTR